MKSGRFMPMIPLRGLSVFPCVVLHFDIGREKSIKALEKAMLLNQTIFLATQRSADTDLPTAEDFYHIGTVVKVKQMLRLPGDNVRVLVEGVCRGIIEEVLAENPYFKVRISEYHDPAVEEPSAKMEALTRTLLDAFDQYLELNPRMNGDIFGSVASMKHPGRLADVAASHMEIGTDAKQQVLEAFDIEKRLEVLSDILARENEILAIENDLNAKVKDEMNKHQREYFLREKMRAIQEELGQGEDMQSEVEEWTAKLAELDLPQVCREKAEKEIKRFSRMPSNAPDVTVIRSYMDWILTLPWNKLSEDNLDLVQAKKILDEDHYGLEKVKERVLEYLAVMQLSKGLKGPILCLAGPPGTGKTSIAKSVARSLNREFVRMSLGGVRDEAEIRGHRRTYIGAIPGRIISAIKEAGTANPVFLFDEVDKIGTDFRGDPASALLEVLDPEQNKDFTDHYLEMPFDLSKVMFITTANNIDTIPRPLLDRMEVIEVSGYTEEDKVKIAQNYLLPKTRKDHGLEDHQLSLTEKAVRDVINFYTRESGVRNLQREIGSICRKTARQVVEKKKTKVRVTPANLESYLGKKRFHHDEIAKENKVGVVMGMAWTAVGGATLSIETAVLEGTGHLVLTGQLGEVMQESAKAGLSYIRSKAAELGIDGKFYKEKDLHIHIPEGATPKDGPSAGVTMCTSMISALTGIPVRNDLAMTGEITLLGAVLPVGGIKEKVLAAHRAGVRKILLPKENEADISEIPASVRKELEFVLISHMDQVLQEALVK
ncbi:MAG: endopeptidase La [Clostridiales bacterium]|nr:endopeptidase La [Clostridiales bacterium]